MSELATKTAIRTKKVAPDGGWGYLVPFGIAIPSACSLGSFASFGLLFNDFITSCGGETSAVTIITGCYFSAFSFAGLLASSLFKKYSMRSVGLCGSLIFFAGSFLTTFATSVEYLVVTFGILEGAGLGIMVPVGYTTFTRYFDKKRVFMMSITQALKGVGIMLYPLIVQHLVDHFGFRGATALVSAIHAHTIFAMLVMQPVEWHMKEVPIPLEESEPLVVSNGKDQEVRITLKSTDDFTVEEEKNNNLSVPNLTESDEKIKIARVVRIERSVSLDAKQILNEFEPVKKRIASIMSLGDSAGNAIITDAYGRVKDGKWQKVVDFLDLTLFRDFVYVNIILGCSFTLYADTSFFTLLPMYLFELGFTKPETAQIVSIGAAADLGSRLCLAFLAYFVHLQARQVTLFGTVATIFVRCILLTMTEFKGVAILIATMGFFRTWLHVTVPLIFADHLPHERYASGYGLYMFFQGNMTFLISPFVGWIRDTTQSYVICFNALSIIMCLCAIPWILEMIWFRIKGRQSTTNTE